MFWGLILEPNRCYSQKVEHSFHISKAALDIFAASDEPSQIMLTFQKRNYLLCTLQKDHDIQCDLDLNFDAGEIVSFATNGASNVHLTGYLNEDGDEDFDDEEVEDEEDETETLEEFVESDTNSKKRKKQKTAIEVPVKKSRTIQLLEDAANSYNSDDDPTFNFSQDSDSDDEDDIEEGSSVDENDAEDSDEESGSDDDEDLLDELNSSNDNVFLPELNGTSKRTRNRKSVSAPEEVVESSPKPNLKKNKTPKKQELNNDQSPKAKSPKTEMKAQKNENKTPKMNKTPGKNDKTPNAKNETPKQNNSNENNKQGQTPAKRIIEGGLIIQDLKEGEGKPVKDGKMVQVYYEGRFKSNNKVFDSTKQGAGFKFRVGKREVIKGWDLGLVGMKVGGKRRITCPPNMAYGQKGSPPVIPPNSTLVFEVEVKKVQ